MASLSSLLGRPSWPIIFALSIPALLLSRRLLRGASRPQKIPKNEERVLILGASSGIGRAVALEYAARGARICVVGRREGELKKVEEECTVLASGDKSRVLSIAADIANAEDMVRVRTLLENKWEGLDTLILSAGVSSLRPLLEIAGLERHGQAFIPEQATHAGIQHTVDVANKALEINVIGPIVTAVTFIPLLQSRSASPAVLLVSSLAAVVPAPTRTLYNATKAASLILYQALAIEHPTVAFSNIIPGTVEGNFRASAVDGGSVRELDPNKHGLKIPAVAKRCVQMVDAGEKNVFMPVAFGRVAHFFYWLMPTAVEQRAAKKYNFTA
ncbi:NAD-P-binding protein [Obba rivulosa]|uniref:NAD-P-binding protein n=1 Tax=Obba rivulosa TaxID=1052685 RepID=A0A8E2DTM2_9APHY|nr:NAD-P-binding protein [Obba rivulosa]